VAAKPVAMAALRLGAGRTKAGEPIDFAVGISHLVKIGDQVSAGAVLAFVHASDEAKAAAAALEVLNAIRIGHRITPPALIDSVLSG
jgi:thymidine phosphorylase